ncbi:MAG: EamA family transporter [Rhodopseudomonas sp.]|nr:EamA family transporter [Rhodopseudomonas sp.]
MFGGFLSLLSAVTFAYANASVRRGVLTGTVLQAVAISLPVAFPFFILAMAVSGGFAALGGFDTRTLVLLALAGIVHFALARYCNYRATKAIGANLVAPVQQYSLVITLALAVLWLGEALTVLRILGIVMVVAGPAFTLGPDKKPAAPPAGAVATFAPQYREGYLYALLSAVGFGLSPILVGMAFETKGLAIGIAGGFVSYVAATLLVALAFVLPGQRRSFREIDSVSAKWFVVSGIAVGLSQMFRYMALAIAPVSVVSPIQRLSLVFRIYFGAWLNPHHEVFGGRVIIGTVISLLGAVFLSVSTDGILHGLMLPQPLLSVLAWTWHFSWP